MGQSTTTNTRKVVIVKNHHTNDGVSEIDDVKRLIAYFKVLAAWRKEMEAAQVEQLRNRKFLTKNALQDIQAKPENEK